MSRKSWLQLPYVGVILVGTGVWGAGSTYWYVCVTEGLCSNTATTVQSTTAKSTDNATSPNEVAATAQPVVLPLMQEVFFLPDSTDETADPSLDQIAAYAKAHPGSIVHVVGYYADVQSATDVGDLSQVRAAKVAKQLANLGVPEKQIQTMANGADPSASGDDEAAVANGRRVEVTVK